MKGTRLLLLWVSLLVLTGAGLFAWKVARLGYPMTPSETRDEWSIEAKVVFQGTGEPVKVSLALPEHLESRLLSSESASVGYGFLRERGEHWRAVWTAQSRSGAQRLYFRIRVPASALKQRSFPATKGRPNPERPDLAGLPAEAAEGLLGDLRKRSADAESFLRLSCAALLDGELQSEAGVLRRFYETRTGERWFETAVIDLAAHNGIKARVAYGVRLEREPVTQAPERLIEYLEDGQWIVFDPAEPSAVFPADVAVWSQGGTPLLTVEGGRNSAVTFATSPVRVAAAAREVPADQPVLVSLFNSLPLSEQSVFRYIVLIPIGVLVVVVFRNLIGIETLGTFMPVLLALAFLEIPIVLALSLLGAILVVALTFRFLLSRLHLLVVPRVAACVVVVSLLMLVFSAVGQRIGFTTSLQITLFPLIILAWTVERMSLIWEEEGAMSSLRQIFGSVVVAASAYALMRLDLIQHLLTYFPELLLVVLALIISLGRYTGYRVTELIRFRQAEEGMV